MLRSRLLCAALLALLAAPAASAQPRPQAPDFWWPDHLDLSPLRQHAAESDPLAGELDYAAGFSRLDLAAVKRDIAARMTSSQPWWPADYGHYGPFFIRMAWHSAGTYRVTDGRGGGGGGQQRFEPLNSWPDNVNLDKARRLLWPVKQKYGQQLSWGDLMVLAGNVALESMGMPTLGFGGGRRDEWQPDLAYWGPEREMLAAARQGGDRKVAEPLAAAQMGLIYVNPQGPGGNPDPRASARDIRDLFGRMAMNDEETVALIAGGHTFGKAHGAHDPARCLGPEPAAAGPESQGLGWANHCGKGHGADTVTSGLEGAWSASPTQWTGMYLDNLFAHEWVKTKSPAGATQWVPADDKAAREVPDAADSNRHHPPIMFTTDLALREDPAYRAVALRFRDHPEAFQAAFAQAWFKLTHRDMGPRARYLGREVPRAEQIWQDPIPAPSRPALAAGDVARLRAKIAGAGIPAADLVRTAWAAAASFRGTDMRGGANGARLALAPQNAWAVNDPPATAATVARLRAVQEAFNRAQKGRAQASLADTIVLAGTDAVERAARAAGEPVRVPFAPGRADATAAQTDVASFAHLEPKADGFRNYYADGQARPPVAMLVERAEMLRLSVPEMAVLLGGLRALNANFGGSPHGVLTDRPGMLTPDFFVNLLDMATEWHKSATAENLYEGRERATGKPRWTATSVDLAFGSNSELRAVAEVYAQADARAKFARDFARAWAKVMNLDRFDLARPKSP